MLHSKDKISLRQVMLMLIVIEFSPIVRIAANSAAKTAKQASWICGILSIIPVLVISFILNEFFRKKKYREAHIMDIIKDIMGNIAGRIIIVVYLLWFLLLWAFYIRFFAGRIVSTIMPNTNISIFIISMLIMIAIALHSGITVIARMSEIIIMIVTFTMYILFLFALPLVKLKNISPVYFTDILPVFSGSAIFWAIYGYLIAFFFFGDQINDKEKLIKFGIYEGIFVAISNTFLLILTIGTLGYSLVERVPRATYVFIKQISVFGVFERVESIVLVEWVLSDFVIIYVFAYAILCIIKDTFKLSDYKPFILPLVTLGYFLSLLISNNLFELEKASQFLVPYAILIEYAIPLIVIIVGKIRRII